MASTSQNNLAGELSAALGKKFSGIDIEVGESDRWKRPCLTFRWDGFANLLPEERFHRLVSELPQALRDVCLSGFVWLELAPGESVDAFLKLPRSEDAAAGEPDVYAGLVEARFFDALAKALGRSPQKSCSGDFSKSEAAIRTGKAPAVASSDARLVFIRHGAYCDCQVLETVRPALEKQYGGAK